MSHSFKLSRRIARLRAPLLASLVFTLACDSTDSLDPSSSLTPEESGVEIVSVAEPEPIGAPELASASFAGGIPFGMSAQPLSLFNGRFNGAKLTIGPSKLMYELQTIRSRGGRVVIMFAGNPRHYTDGDGNFSLSKWKSRIDLFRSKDIGSYIKDGTITGHYLIDEPNDPRNWNGRTVSPATVEEMAKYSKQIWPDMATIVRARPDYMGYNHRYLDAAWAAYLSRWGDVDDFLKKNVAAAQARGLALVVGMNVMKGGTPKGTRMTAKEVESWGSAMLNSSYPCAFLMYEYNSDFLSSSGMGSAMDALRRKAENRSTKSCRS